MRWLISRGRSTKTTSTDRAWSRCRDPSIDCLDWERMATTTRSGTVTREQYLQIHRWMCMAKALDDRMHIGVKQGRARFVGSSRGHEGIQVASTAALRADDWLVPHYRGLANSIVRGLTMKEWMLAVFAKAADPLSAGRNIPGG